MREALSADREPGQETGADIGHAEGDEFLVGVDLLAVFRSKNARGQYLIGVDQDREGQGGRQQRKDILHRDRGDRQLWKAGRHRPDDRDALGREIKHDRGEDGANDNDQRAGNFAIHEAYDEQRRHTDGANGNGQQVRFVEAADEFHNLPEELVALKLDAEHLAQLAADDDQRRADDVADQHRLGQEVGDEAQPRDPGEQRDDADEECEQRGERSIARSIAAGQRRNGGCRHDRGRRLRSHDDLFGGAKQRIHHHGAERDIQSCDGSDPGEVAVGHCRGHEHRKHRDGHDEFGAQQRGTEPSDQGQAGNESGNARGWFVAVSWLDSTTDELLKAPASFICKASLLRSMSCRSCSIKAPAWPSAWIRLT